MKVLIAENVVQEAIDMFKAAGLEIDIKPTIDGEELVKAIPEYHAIMIRSKPTVTRAVIEAGKNLKVIGRAGVGLDNVDRQAAKEKGVEVVNSPEASTISVAEHAIALMLSISRQIPAAEKSMRDGKWDRKTFKGVEVHGKTLGIIGFGRIGREVAKMAKGLGMKIITYDPQATSEDAEEYDCKLVKLDELFASSDYITLHVPNIPATQDMINKDTLAKMKKTAYLINTARGAVINEDDLYNALKDKKIAGAAIDVYKTEPPTGSSLIGLDNIVLTPHLAASTKEAQVKAGTVVAEKIIKVLKA